MRLHQRVSYKCLPLEAAHSVVKNDWPTNESAANRTYLIWAHQQCSKLFTESTGGIMPCECCTAALATAFHLKLHPWPPTQSSIHKPGWQCLIGLMFAHLVADQQSGSLHQHCHRVLSLPCELPQGLPAACFHGLHQRLGCPPPVHALLHLLPRAVVCAPSGCCSGSCSGLARWPWRDHHQAGCCCWL